MIANEKDEVPVNDEMTIVEQWMQKQAHAADFVQTVFLDQMDGLEDPDVDTDAHAETNADVVSGVNADADMNTDGKSSSDDENE